MRMVSATTFPAAICSGFGKGSPMDVLAMSSVDDSTVAQLQFPTPGGRAQHGRGVNDLGHTSQRRAFFERRHAHHCTRQTIFPALPLCPNPDATTDPPPLAAWQTSDAGSRTVARIQTPKQQAIPRTHKSDGKTLGHWQIALRREFGRASTGRPCLKDSCPASQGPGSSQPLAARLRGRCVRRRSEPCPAPWRIPKHELRASSLPLAFGHNARFGISRR